MTRDRVQGVARAGARAHLRAIGLRDEDFDKPFIGIANTWTGLMPCNLTFRELGAEVARGVRSAAGVPLEFNTIAVSDAITMGSDGMRASLVSRDMPIRLAQVGSEDGPPRLPSDDPRVPAAVPRRCGMS